jgi:hypothetical protein
MKNPFGGLVVCCALAGSLLTGCATRHTGVRAKASSTPVTQILTASKLSVTPPTVTAETISGGTGLVTRSYTGPYSIAVARQSVLPAANYTIWVDSYPSNTNGAVASFQTFDTDLADNDVATVISESGWMVMSRESTFPVQGTGRTRSGRPKFLVKGVRASGPCSFLSVIEPPASGGSREYFFFIDAADKELALDALYSGSFVTSPQLASGKYMYFDFSTGNWYGPNPLPKLSEVPGFVADALSGAYTRSGKLFYSP